VRIVIFTDANTITSARLVRATLQWAARREGCRVIGFVTTRPTDFRPGIPGQTRALLRRATVAATNANVPFRSVLDFELDLYRLGIPVFVPPGDNPNDPAFVQDLAAQLKPDLLLSFYCRQRLGRRLRSTCKHAVNYHDGLLPDYGGVMATAFSIFAGEPSSGFTFHHMSGKLDAGPILIQNAVPIDETVHLDQVVQRKSSAAAKTIPRLLERLSTGDPGQPQERPGSFYSGHDWMAMVNLSRPENATRKEILRRIRAFGLVNLTIGGEIYPATRIRSARPGDKLAFRTADNQSLTPDRFQGLPSLLYRSGPDSTD